MDKEPRAVLGDGIYMPSRSVGRCRVSGRFVPDGVTICPHCGVGGKYSFSPQPECYRLDWVKGYWRKPTLREYERDAQWLAHLHEIRMEREKHNG